MNVKQYGIYDAVHNFRFNFYAKYMFLILYIL